MTTKRKIATATLVLTGMLSLAACADSGNVDSGTDSVGTQGSPADSAAESDAADHSDCYVHLFDGDDFDEDDSNFILTEPGRYEDLRDLPGADKDWSDEADSLKVGPSATVTIWSEPGFSGTETKLEAGSEEPDLDDEPESLELECN